MKSGAELRERLRNAAKELRVDDSPIDRIVRQGRRRIVRRMLVMGISGSLVVAALAGGLVGISRLRGHPSAPSGPTLRSIERVDVFGRAIRRPVAAYGAFWSIVQEGGGGKLILARVDARTLRARIVPGLVSPQTVAAGFGSIWVTTTCPRGGNEPSCPDGVVVRLDPAGRVQATIHMGGLLYPIGTGEGMVWVGQESSPGHNSVIRIDPSTNVVLDTVSLDDFLPHRYSCCLQEISPAEGAVWLMVGDGLARLDPTTLEVSLTEVRGDLIVAGAGAVWVNTARLGPAPIIRVDRVSGQAVASIDGPGFGYPAIGIGGVWLAVTPMAGPRRQSVELYRIDPATNAIERILALPLGPYKGGAHLTFGPAQQVAIGEGAGWVTDGDAWQVVRIDLRAMESTLPPTPETSAPMVTHFDLDAIPIGPLLPVQGALWTIVESREDLSLSVVHIDAASGAIEEVPFGKDLPLMLSAGFGSVWVAGCPQRDPVEACPDGTVYRLDPSTMEITAKVRIGGDITALTAGDDAVWLGQHTYVNNEPQPGYLFRLDPGTLALHRYSLEPLRFKRPPCCVRAVASLAGAVWIIYGDYSRLVRMDPASGRFTELGAYGGGLIVDGGAVWLEGRTERLEPAATEGTLRIDPETNEVTGVGPVAASVTAENGQVWVVEKSGDLNDRTLTVERLDTATGQPIGRPIRVEAGPPKINFECGGCGWHVTIAYGEGSVWLTIMDALEVIRITPPP
jgi:hypothetical protein